MFVEKKNCSEIVGNMSQNVLTPVFGLVHYDSLQILVEATSPYLSKFNEIIFRICRLGHVEFDSKL